ENIEESDYKISEAANDIMPNTIGVVTTEFQENSIKKFIENRVEDLLSDTEIETPNSFTDNENEIQSLLENTEVEEETAVAEPINTFFDSSIPSISTSNVDTVFAKTKKSLSSIFKKFSFEETALNNNINPKFEEIDSNEIINNITSINTNTSEKPIDLVVPEIKVDAEPIDVTVPVIETDISTLNDSTNVENEFNEVSNVLSQDSSIENISFDEEEIEKLIESDNTVELNEDSNKQEIDYENSNSLDVLPELDEDDDSLEDVEEFSYDEDFNYDDVKEQDVKESYDDDSFSIESYFGLDKLTDEDFADETDTEITEETVEEENENVEELENIDNEEIDNSFTEEANNSSADEKNNVSEFSTITKLLESFNESINNLSDKISVLETENKSLLSNTKEIATVQPQENDIVETNTEQIQEEDNNIEENTTSIPEQQSLSDFEISDEELMEFLANEENTDNLDTSEETLTETETVNKDNESDVEAQIVEDILSEAILSDDTSVDDEELKNSLLSEVLSAEEDVNSNNTDEKIDSDFSKVLECLTKAINDLEDHKAENNQIANKEEKKDVAPIIPEEIYTEEISPESGKAINILIDKDDIFSIQILNETYEIVADFDGISVLSENIHISTPKNNFYVKIGEKYIEIHNNKDHFSVYTNFEDVEFANAINNVGFAKKNNRIELNIKEAFKLASVNNRIELSMLNKTIASIKDTPVTQIDENSICDNKTLLISEETQKVYLPYTISEVMNKLKYNDEYKSIQDVVDKEYTVPLSTFKMPIISRFREAYMFMRTKENSSIYAAIDLAVELMFNSNLNPAVIRAAKDLKELNIYLDCLYENEVDKFDCFKIIYKVLPKIK
ncbi:MAG: hypothetical protein Q4E69_07005, partial [Bacilli bacterium]|nr:hypothetical protein [Bacilli bacterium]